MAIVNDFPVIAKRYAELNGIRPKKPENPKAFPFWNAVGDYVVRFLPDGNKDSPFFWVNKPTNNPRFVSGIFQGFVTSAPDGVEVPRNIIQTIHVTSTVLKILKHQLLVLDFEGVPCDFDFGCDFKI